MARLLGTLRSSQPVARFQRSCGLFPAAEEGGCGGDPAEGPRARGACNGAGALRCPQGCTQKYIVKNYFYYYLFKFSAALANEYLRTRPTLQENPFKPKKHQHCLCATCV